MKVIKRQHNELYDLIIWGIGYESRSAFTARKFSSKADTDIAFGYTTNTDVCAYQSCKEFFKARGSEIHELTDEEFEKFLQSDFFTGKVTTSKRILLDITVFTRKRIASLIVAIYSYMSLDASLTLSYSPSEYVAPPAGNSPISVFGPLHNSLSGEIGDISKLSALILGLGYEKGKAAGIFSYLECDVNYLLYPISQIKNFEKTLRTNNKYVFDSIPKDHIYRYDLDSPLLTYSILSDLVMSCSNEFRTVLVPLGPKILTALCVIIGINLPSLAVWRVSSDHTEIPVDRRANGKQLMFSLIKQS